MSKSSKLTSFGVCCITASQPYKNNNPSSIQTDLLVRLLLRLNLEISETEQIMIVPIEKWEKEVDITLEKYVHRHNSNQI